MKQPVRFSESHKIVLDAMLLSLTGVTPGKMFGYPAYYMQGKMFACLYENGVGIKLPAEKAQGLVGSHQATWFQPLGRAKMREWIQIDHDDSSVYKEDWDVLEASFQYVLSKI